MEGDKSKMKLITGKIIRNLPILKLTSIVGNMKCMMRTKRAR